jgi:hypothetical protein
MKKMFVLVVISLVSSTAMAATTTYETRAVNNGVNNADYKASWDAQTSAITTQVLADFNDSVVPGNVSGGFSHLKIDFNTQNAGSEWGFRLAPDAGLGGAIYLDGIQIGKDTSDLWWGGNWNNASEIFSQINLSVAAGNHSFEGYWAENCCNGKQGVQYTLNNGQVWQTTSDLASPAAVPVPATLWLFGSGLMGLMGYSRRKQGQSLAA